MFDIKEEKKLFIFFEENGYFDIRKIEGRGYCGLCRFVFTTGLVIGLDEMGYFGRYCFENFVDAKEALNNWDGTGDVGGEWIKFKGIGGDRSRIKDPHED